MATRLYKLWDPCYMYKSHVYYTHSSYIALRVYLVHDCVEGVQCIDNSDVPELGVVRSSRDLDAL